MRWLPALVCAFAVTCPQFVEAEPARSPILVYRPPAQRQCVGECDDTIEVTGTTKPLSQAPSDDDDAGCIPNPILEHRYSVEKRGIISGVQLEKRTTVMVQDPSGKSRAVWRDISIFLYVPTAKPGETVLQGQLCAPATDRDRIAAAQMRIYAKLLETAPRAKPLTPAEVNDLLTPNGETRGRTDVGLEVPASKGFRIAAPTFGSWLMGWSQGTIRKLIIRSLPTGQHLLLDGRQLPLRTDATISVKQEALARLAVMLADKAVPLSSCRLAPDAEADGIFTCARPNAR